MMLGLSAAAAAAAINNRQDATRVWMGFMDWMSFSLSHAWLGQRSHRQRCGVSARSRFCFSLHAGITVELVAAAGRTRIAGGFKLGHQTGIKFPYIFRVRGILRNVLQLIRIFAEVVEFTLGAFAEGSVVERFHLRFVMVIHDPGLRGAGIHIAESAECVLLHGLGLHLPVRRWITG